MKERPILMSGPLVVATMKGLKTQTRRVLNLPAWFKDEYPRYGTHDIQSEITCPYGAPGDRLWVRETWAMVPRAKDGFEKPNPENPHNGFRYKATWTKPHEGRWTPSIHMWRRASRLTLEITEVRVQRLQDISEEDARAEGVLPFFERFPSVGRDQRITSGEFAADVPYRASFAVLWDEINGDRLVGGKPVTWAANPWAWAINYRGVELSGKAP